MTDAERLFLDYRPLALRVASRFYLPGAEPDDVRQEALLGLWTAVLNYDPARGPFEPLAFFGVYSRLKTAMTAANRMKHRPLNWSTRELELESGDVVAAADALEDRGADVHELAVSRAEWAGLLEAVDRMTPLERRCVVGYAVGLSYAELVEQGHAGSFKSVDNALARVRARLREAA